MARVTVEDCVLKVPNRFELVMLAAQRARNLGAGAPLSIDRDNDKNPVVALREIADGKIAVADLQESLIRGLQKTVETDEPEADELDLLAMSRPMEVEAARDEDELAEDDLRLAGEEGEGAIDEEEAGPDLADLDDDAFGRGR